MLNNQRTNNLTGHGSAYDRGSADKYYGRGFQPHYYKGNSYTSARVGQTEMTGEEIEAYRNGYNEETDTKDWEGY